MEKSLYGRAPACIYFFMILTLFLPLLAPGHGWGQDPSGLSLTLYRAQEYPDSEYTIGEPIELIMVLKNVPGWPLNTDKGFSSSEIQRSLILTDSSGTQYTVSEGGGVADPPPPYSVNDRPVVPAENLAADYVRSVTIENLTDLFPVMKTTLGWFTLEAHLPFARYAWVLQDPQLGLVAVLDDDRNWSGTIDSNKLQFFIAPEESGAQLHVRVMDQSVLPSRPLAQIPVKVFRVNDLPSEYDLADVWERFKPVLTGKTRFEEGWTVWDSAPCVPENGYTIIAYFSPEYQESLIVSGAGVGWATGCTGSIERVIHFGEAPFPALSSFSLFAVNSLWVKAGAVVHSGNIGVLDESPGLWLDSGVEVSIGIGAKAEDGIQIFGDSVKIRRNASVYDVFYNNLDNRGTIRGDMIEGLDLPLFEELPTFPEITPGTKNVTVRYRRVKNLAPGKYRNVTIRSRGTLRLTGGEYHFKNLNLSNRSALVCLAPAEIRIKKRLYPGLNSRLGPDPGSNLTAKDVVLYIEGTNGNIWNLLSYPKAAKIGAKSEVKANLFVPNGTLLIGTGSKATGSFIAQGVIVGINSNVILESAF